MTKPCCHRIAACRSVWVCCLVCIILSPSSGWAAVRTEVQILHARVEGAAAVSAKLEKFVKTKKGEIVTCYQKARKDDPGMVARLIMEVSVTAQGFIKDVRRDRSSFASEALYKCVVGTVTRWRINGWQMKHEIVAGLGFGFWLTAAVPKGATVSGGLKGKYVAGVFTAYQSRLEKCYKKPPESTVKLQVTVLITQDGHVTSVKIQGRHRDGSAKRCMEKEMKRWRFPYGHHGHRSYVVYPIVIGSGEKGRSSSRVGLGL